MSRYFGARGCVSPQQRQSMNRFLAKCRKDSIAQKRVEIAALSNRDIQVMMAEVIVDATTKRRSVVRKDFEDAGLPAHRLDKNKDAAFRLARRMEPRLDAMLDGGAAA